MHLSPPLFALALFLLAACAPTGMQVEPQQALVPAPPGKAQIIFLHSSPAGGDSRPSVYDVTSGYPFFIGIVANSTRIRHLTDPGKRTFMAASEGAEFMQAELAAGRTYYALVVQEAGGRQGRFSLHPVKKNPASRYSTASPEFVGWLAGTRQVDTTPALERWARDNHKEITEKYHDSWPAWLRKTPEEKELLTLHPDDGE